MKTIISSAAAIALLAPVLAFAQVYYYAPNTTSGAFNYGSSQYIPSYAMPYVQMGYQMQQQSQGQYGSYMMPSSYSSYSNPMQSQSQYQYQNQYQTSYPTYNSYTMPSYNSYNYSSNTGEFSQPNSTTYPSGTYGPFGTQLCYWSDYPTYAPCGKDPQQWIQDPYTGQWY